MFIRRNKEYQMTASFCAADQVKMELMISFKWPREKFYCDMRQTNLTLNWFLKKHFIQFFFDKLQFR